MPLSTTEVPPAESNVRNNSATYDEGHEGSMAFEVATVDTLACDAGWRDYHYLKITTREGIAGWAEYDESYGPVGVTAAIEHYGKTLLNRDVRPTERHHQGLAGLIRSAPNGVAAEAAGAIENALLDIKAKALGVPVYELLGGKLRDAIPVYWSHCATWRINHPTYYHPQITLLDDVRAAGQEARERGHTVVKTNMFTYGPDGPKPWYPGFGAPFDPARNLPLDVIKDTVEHLEALSDGAGEGVQVMLDINFNTRADGARQLLRALEHLDLYWLELDLDSPEELADVRSVSPFPISSCETATGARQLLPYLQHRSIDVALIDVVWNGAWQAMKMATVADAYGVNVAPHNFYSHLATMMSLQFAAAVPNLRIMEVDVDRLPWDEELFPDAPTITDGHITVPTTPGWGIEPIEDAIRARPAKRHRGYLGT